MKKRMDKRRQELEELQGDLHLAFLMDEYAEELGEEVRAEAEKAFEAGEISIPSEVDDTCAAILAQTAKAEPGKKSAKSATRYFLVAAATVVLLLGTLMVVQAAGIDVFGRLASWTDSVFHYSDEQKPSHAEEAPFAEIRAALSNLNLPVDLAPSLFPEGYSVTSINPSETGTVKNVVIVLEKQNLKSQIIIEEHLDEKLIENAQWEKVDQTAKVFSSNGRDYYLIENQLGWSGTWSNGRYLVSLFGFESYDELTLIIKSIGVE